jgi:hypothetical protein
LLLAPPPRPTPSPSLALEFRKPWPWPEFRARGRVSSKVLAFGAISTHLGGERYRHRARDAGFDPIDARRRSYFRLPFAPLPPELLPPSDMRVRWLGAAGASSLLAAAYYDERVRRQIVIPVVGGAARLFVRGVNDLTLHDAHHLHAGLQRPAGTGMLTVSNHISTMDDPGLLAAIVPLRTLCDPDEMRWGVCAEDVCFRPGSWIERCASTAKVLPVVRGGGVRQPELDGVAAKLQAGQWVHCARPLRTRLA